jgi:hypothetical protein
MRNHQLRQYLKKAASHREGVRSNAPRRISSTTRRDAASADSAGGSGGHSALVEQCSKMATTL